MSASFPDRRERRPDHRPDHRPERRRGRARARGFTLIELLVATGILVVLGTSLILVLRGGLSTWRRAEARRESYDTAQAVLRQLREDLGCVVPPDVPDARGVAPAPDARFLCDLDDAGRQRLFLVRSLTAESEHPLTGFAGSAVGADAVIDQRHDLEEARAGRLRATGGLCEVAWVQGPDGVLYRGVRTPAGPPGSLFGDVLPYDLAPPPSALTALEASAIAAASGDPAAAAPDSAAPGGDALPAAGGLSAGPAGERALLRPFATNVLYLELRFWTQYTTSWGDAPPLREAASPDEESGALDYWDSTRAMLRAEDAGPREFQPFRGASSRLDARDDIFPSKVRVLLVVSEPPAAGSQTALTAPVDERATELRVQDAGRMAPDGGFLYIHGEWIHYEEVRGDRVLVRAGGRGARGTTPQAHDGNHPVLLGRTFEAIFEVPAGREDWGDRSRGGGS